MKPLTYIYEEKGRSIDPVQKKMTPGSPENHNNHYLHYAASITVMENPTPCKQSTALEAMKEIIKP